MDKSSENDENSQLYLSFEMWRKQREQCLVTTACYVTVGHGMGCLCREREKNAERQDTDKNCKPTHTDTRAEGACCNHSIQLLEMIDIPIHLAPPQFFTAKINITILEFRWIKIDTSNYNIGWICIIWTKDRFKFRTYNNLVYLSDLSYIYREPVSSNHYENITF